MENWPTKKFYNKLGIMEQCIAEESNEHAV